MESENLISMLPLYLHKKDLHVPTIKTLNLGLETLFCFPSLPLLPGMASITI